MMFLFAVLLLLAHPLFHGFALGHPHNHGTTVSRRPLSFLEKRAYFDRLARNVSIARQDDYSCGPTSECFDSA